MTTIQIRRQVRIRTTRFIEAGECTPTSRRSASRRARRCPGRKLDVALKWAVFTVIARRNATTRTLLSAIQHICRQSTDRVGWCLEGPASSVNREQVAIKPEEKDHVKPKYIGVRHLPGLSKCGARCKGLEDGRLPRCGYFGALP